MVGRLAAGTDQRRNAATNAFAASPGWWLLERLAARSRRVHRRFFLGPRGHDRRRRAPQYSENPSRPWGRQFRFIAPARGNVRPERVEIGAQIEGRNRGRSFPGEAKEIQRLFTR